MISRPVSRIVIGTAVDWAMAEASGNAGAAFDEGTTS